ncbi:3-dehydroquinate synthase [Gammaproteobacteria bacterium]|nr:3-dehydroquinate synthase [Gammaproteobacteria bacterium]
MAAHVDIVLDDDRAYRVLIDSGAISNKASWVEALGSKVAVITNATVGDLYIDTLASAIDRDLDVIEIGDGEEFKNLKTFSQVIDRLVDGGHNRDSTIIALGGGVVGDIAGFVAASYQRGIGYIQVPTTLLAQVDSSVGGKTAVNHPSGKNLIGAFYQPDLVVADTDTLTSLPEREYFAGIAEVIKYGVIGDPEFFQWLEANVKDVSGREPSAMEHAIHRSCQLKAGIVTEDEREMGNRAKLNFGHTFAHAIETTTGYRSYLHGEAVAIGMVMAADLSVRMDLCQPDTADRIRQLIEAYKLPVTSPKIPIPVMLETMARDKKVIGGRMRFVLVKRIGEASVESDVPQRALEETLVAGTDLSLG